ncbi:MAG: ribonuclease R [Bacteroidetes bacterium]|nr:MAG: ribonuclease R [Bacteroidota bacterium]
MSKLPSRKQIRRDILRLLRNHGKQSFRPKEIAKRLDYRDQRTYRLFRDVLAEMDEQNMLGKVNGRYTYRPRPTRVEGILRVNPRGFGFVEVEGREEDLYVRETNMGNALDGDLVEVALAAPTRGSGRREAEVLRVIERRRTQVVGTFQQLGRFAFVDPDDQRVTQDVYVPREDFNGAQDGDKVIVSIDRFDDRKASPEGRVLQVLGRADDPEIQVLALAMSFDVRAGFSEEVIREAEAIPDTIPAEEIQRRLDLRHKRIFTIDPADAKDFDDAIHVERLDNGNFEVGVHIADVSHYVRPGTALDAEAYARGTSVYLVDRVIPMLPEKLSNGVCSLRPHEDKLAYSCIMEVSPRGSVKSYQIRETVIHSHHRFTYEEAQTLIDGGQADHPFAPDVVQAARLARTLTRKRLREGAVDFDLPEIRVILDEAGRPVEIVRKERKEANRLIEEFMLLANRTVAHHIGKRRDAPLFIYRVHDRPDAEKIQTLAQYVRIFGYQLNLDNGNVTSHELNKLISHIKGNPEAYVIEDAALRAMSKAKYDHQNIGHYGLGFRYYTHFTSPIRRYPDLIAHRLLKRFARKKQTTSDKDALEAQCRHCSERERVATEAERESVKLKQVEFIRQHLGERFTGVVSGVTNFGVFVELEDVLVEGMVHVRDLDDDYYEYDERTYTLVGVDTGRTFRPGDRVEVQVVAADVETRKVDLVFVD